MRALVYLRSISRSLKTLAEHADRAEARRNRPRLRPKPRRAEFHEFDLASAERKWERQVKAREEGVEWEGDE
jgi:hypothetical protein